MLTRRALALALAAACLAVASARSLSQLPQLPGAAAGSSVPGCQSAWSVVKSNPNFSILEAAVKAAGLVNLLDDPTLIATIFAPDDVAFTKTLKVLALSPQELLDKPELVTAILQTHIVPRTLPKSLLKAGQAYDTLLVANGEKLPKSQPVAIGFEEAITYSFKGVTREFSIGGAKVVAFDVNKGCPSVIHVIGGVIVPEIKEMAELSSASVEVDAVAAGEVAARRADNVMP